MGSPSWAENVSFGLCILYMCGSSSTASRRADLMAAGIDLPKNDGNYIGLMRVFADTWTTRDSEKMSKRVKLIETCKLLNIKHRKAHTAIGDSAVLIPTPSG